MRTTHVAALSCILVAAGSAMADVPAPATLGSPPAGFAVRTGNAPTWGFCKLAQNPVSRNIYALYNGFSTTRLYRVNTGGASITFTEITNAAGIVSSAQGLTFDRFGNVYLCGQVDKIVKGTDTNADPNVDTFSFSTMLDFVPDLPGTEHGLGGLVVGPDDKLYFNNGAQTSNGPESDTTRFGVPVNHRILRCNLDGTGLEVFADGSRNHFGMAFRADGKLFGVDNGPKINCASGGNDYGEELNLIAQGSHLGFPYYFGNHLSGSDRSLGCALPSPPGGTYTGAWRNNGPNGKPAAHGTFHSFDPHSSVNGITFYEPSKMDPATIKFPADFHGRAFVARFGQLESGISNRGFDVLSLALNDADSSFACNAFLTNMGRAMDVLAAYNGKLYILEWDQSTSGTNLTTGVSRVHEISYTIPPAVPVIALSPTTINRSVDYTAALADTSFTVDNTGGGTLEYTISDNAAWLGVSPTSGTSTGEADTITVSFPGVSGLSIGQHQAIITVSDPDATNNPQTVTVTVDVQTVAADYDDDGDVDLDDFAHLQACYSESAIAPIPPECADASLDANLPIDQLDLALFKGCFGGAGEIADPNCLN